MKTAPKLAAAMALAAIFGGCGGKGSSDGGDGGSDAVDDGGDGGILSPEVRDVSGQFFLGTAAYPATGLDVWVADHTSGGVLPVPLDDTGSFRVPLEAFSEDHVYTLHVVDHYELLHDVDVMAATPGTQTAFRYDGGYGFDLGRIILPLDAQGAVDRNSLATPGRVGGGFSLSADDTVSLADMPLPKLIESAALGSALLVTDPATILYGVYRRGSFPDIYARMLADASALDISIAGSKYGLTRAAVSDAGAWLASARLVDDKTGVASPWAASDFAVPKLDSRKAHAHVLVGASLSAQSIVVLKVLPSDGTPQLLVPRLVGPILGLPPQVTAVGLAGGALTAVDYTSSTVANGLTRPFCPSGDLTLQLVPPHMRSGVVVPGGELDEVDVALEIYGRAGGVSTLLPVPKTAWGSGWRAARTDAVSGASRTWDPAAQTLTHVLTAPAAAAQTLTIPSALFPASVERAAVASYRLRVTFKSRTRPLQAGTIVWVNRGC
jgi:hypothetical protein